jgi:hypothetical protein
MLGMDCETGGIGDDKSLLTSYFGFFKLVDDKFVLLDELVLKNKPNDNIYHVTAESFEINKINLIEHDKVAITEKLAGQLLYAKLKDWSRVSNDKLIPIGHNVVFDIRKITTTLISEGSWGSFVSYKTMDTATIAQYLKICGKLPANVSSSLGQLAAYFKVNAEGNQHEAKHDVLLTIGVLENFMKFMK